MSDIDKGAFAKSELTIIPTANGSYLIRKFMDRDNGIMRTPDREMMAFSDYTDLLAFLAEDYRVANLHPASPPTA